jgi:hypothetical protein
MDAEDKKCAQQLRLRFATLAGSVLRIRSAHRFLLSCSHIPPHHY